MNRGRSRNSPEAAHSITGAVQSHSEDLDARIKRYLFSMALRTICVVLVLVIHSPVRWVFAVLAVILPYVAVVMANAAGNRRRKAPPAPTSIQLIPLTAGAPLPPGGPVINYETDAAFRPEATTRPSPVQPNSPSHERTS